MTYRSGGAVSSALALDSASELRLDPLALAFRRRVVERGKQKLGKQQSAPVRKFPHTHEEKLARLGQLRAYLPRHRRPGCRSFTRSTR